MSAHKRPNSSTIRLQPICCVLLTIVIAGCGGKTITATSLLRVNLGDADKSTFETYKQTQAQLLTSSFVLRAALRAPEISQLSTLRDLPKPVEWLEKHIKTKYPGDSEILKVSLQCLDPDDAKAIVDAVVCAFMAEVAQADRNDRAERLEILRATYRAKTEELKEAFEVAERLSAEIGVAGSARAAANQDVAMENLKSLNSQLAKLKYDLVNSQTDLYVQEARQQFEKSPTPTPDADLELLAAKMRLRAQVAAVQASRKEYADAHQVLRDLSGFSAELEVRKLETSILTERVTTISNQIYDLEMEVKQKPRIEVIQKADTKPENDSFKPFSD